MGKFCTSCGSSMDDNAKFCVKCGTPVGSFSPVVVASPVPPVYTQQPHVYANPAPVKKGGGGIIAVIFLLIIIGIGVFAFFVVKGFLDADDNKSTSSSSYKSVIETQIKGMEKADWDTYKKAFTKEQIAYISKIYGTGEDFFDEILSSLNDSVGDNIKIKYKIDETKKLDKSDIEDLQDDFDSTYDKSITISEAYELEVTFNLTGDDDETEEDATLIIAKIGSVWYDLSDI